MQWITVVRRDVHGAEVLHAQRLAVSSMVMVIVADSPSSSLNLRGCTVIVPALLSALVVNCCFRPLTFVAARVVV